MGADEDLRGWQLSSDAEQNTSRGRSAHADWFGGWNDEIQKIWFRGCIRGKKNCSIGQLGEGPLDQLARRGKHCNLKRHLKFLKKKKTIKRSW